MTNHKPLTAVLGPKKGIPPLAAARLQRWAWIFSAYTYEPSFAPLVTMVTQMDCLVSLFVSLLQMTLMQIQKCSTFLRWKLSLLRLVSCELLLPQTVLSEVYLYTKGV